MLNGVEQAFQQQGHQQLPVQPGTATILRRFAVPPAKDRFHRFETEFDLPAAAIPSHTATASRRPSHGGWSVKPNRCRPLWEARAGPEAGRPKSKGGPSAGQPCPAGVLFVWTDLPAMETLDAVAVPGLVSLPLADRNSVQTDEIDPWLGNCRSGGRIVAVPGCTGSCWWPCCWNACSTPLSIFPLGLRVGNCAQSLA